MPLETPEEAFRGISGQQYSAVDASNEGGDEIPTDPQNLTIYVQRVLEQMSENFQKMSSNISTRVDEMSKRLGDLERLIEDLQSNSSVAPSHLSLGGSDETTPS